MEAPSKKVIIVVEDNEHIAELIKEALNAEPEYQAVAVHDGALALDVIRSVQASLILLDLMLPGVGGLEIYDILQSDKETRGIPVIFVTATPDNPEFKKRKIKNFIAKPFNLDDLLARVAEVVQVGE